MKLDEIFEAKYAFRAQEGKCDECGDEFDFDRNLFRYSKHEVVCPGCGALLDCDYAAQTLRLAKLNEAFDPNFYDFIQDEMRRKVYDPHEDRPAEDTEMHMGDYIISAFEAGKLSYEEAQNRLKEIADTPLDLQFWRMELAMTAEDNI